MMERNSAAQLEQLNLLGSITRAIGERQDLTSISRDVIKTLEDQFPVDFGCLCLLQEPDSLVIAGVGVKNHPLHAELIEGELIPIGHNGLSRCIAGSVVYEPDLGALPFTFPQRLAAAGLSAMVAAPLLVKNKVFGVLIVARRAAKSFTIEECEFLRQLSEHVALASHQAHLYGILEIAYRDLRQTQEAVIRQEKLRVLGQMASGIAHDINNALAPAVLYVESLLERNMGTSESKEYLAIIQRAIEDVSHSVTRMKQVYGENDPLLRRAPVNLNKAIQHVIDLTHHRWNTVPTESGFAIRLATHLDPNLPEVIADESEIRDSIANLILNACDAMPEGGQLTLRSRILDADRVQIEVCDTGMGMDEATRNRCLDIFFTTKGVRGSGLGLTMVQSTLQRHGGELQIESEVGVGTTMRITLPVGPNPPAPEEIPKAAPTTRRSLHILVIDDDPVILKSLCVSLQRDGHAVEIAPGGRSAIEKFRAALELEQPFEIVITDLGMPQIDGNMVAAGVKAIRPNTPVILLTGWGPELLVEENTPPNVDRVLSKPTRLASIREVIAELTD